MPFIVDDLLLGVPFLLSVWRAYSKARSPGVTAQHAPLFGAGSVETCRAAVPVEPGLKPTSALLGGHIYSGNDPELVAWLKDFLARRAEEVDPQYRRGVLAFAALQGREGSTAAVNTYDNQVFTWGTGWGGLGGLGRVMDTLVQNADARDALAACGVQYLGSNTWAVVDESGGVVTGKREALEVIRRTPALLDLFIHLAKDPQTREAVAEAQLDAFLKTSGNLPGSDTIATQALFNFATHLKHWAPGYMQGVVEEAASRVPGEPSPERDARLAPEVVRGFYARAGKWVPDWRQMQTYVRHMREDGLDVVSDPLLAASTPPLSSGATKTAAGCGLNGAAYKTAGGCGANWSSFKTAMGPGQGDGAESGSDWETFKSAGGCGNWEFPNWDVCGNWGPWGAQFRTVDPPEVEDVRVVAGHGGGGHGGFAHGGHHGGGWHGHGGHGRGHPWYGGGGWWGGGAYDAVFVDYDVPNCYGVLVDVGGVLTCVGALPPVVGGQPGYVYDHAGRALGVAAKTVSGYSLVPPGFEHAREVHVEPESAGGAHSAMGLGSDPRYGGLENADPRMTHAAYGFDVRSAQGPGVGWGEVQDEHGKYVAGPGSVATPDQLAVIKRGVVEAVRQADYDRIDWTQIKVGDYDLMVMNEPISSHGLRLPTSFDDAVEVSKLLGALPITPVISDARWAQAKRVYARPLNDKTGALDYRTPGGADQVVRYNERIGPNTGEFRDGAWKELVVHPHLTESGRGSMAQYGFKDSDTHMFEHGGPSNHDLHYADYSDTPTYVSRFALKSGAKTDLLDEYARGGPLTAAIPGWLVERLRGDRGEVGA